jgi:NAD(P)-dependent dehydrogenase (short-subunit alcohol dehydrogenase family)
MTRFTTHFGFQSTAAEVIAGVDLTGRKAIVTGGAAGVGAETVRALAGAGAAVTMAVRRVDVAETDRGRTPPVGGQPGHRHQGP